jgi:hypothetical protein
LVPEVAADILTELGTDEAWARLGTMNVGRLATSSSALPLVVPVHYVVGDDRELIFGVAPASSLVRAVDGGVYAFEAGGPDSASERWWSVVVRGRTSLLRGDDPLAAPLRSLGLPADVAPVLGQADLVHGGEVASWRQLPLLGAHLSRQPGVPRSDRG